MANHDSAESLLALMQSGDMFALDRFAREYGSKLMAVARRQCHLPADAEDAVQQALEAASTSMTGIRADGSPIAWLSTLVARNCYRLNKQAARGEPLQDGPCHCDDPLAVAERKELATSLGDALMTLSRTDRLVFLLAAEGFTSVEIADRFELSPDAVRSRLKRARAHLRQSIENPDTLDTAASTSPGSHQNPA